MYSFMYNISQFFAGNYSYNKSYSCAIYGCNCPCIEFIIYLDNLEEEYSAELPAPVRNIGDVTAVQPGGQLSGGGGEKGKVGGSIQSITNNGALAGSEFAYTTPCLVKGKVKLLTHGRQHML